jgi:hypothetical protein
MARYNRSSNPCFAGHCRVRLQQEDNSIAVQDLRPGMIVWTPCGPRRVKAVVATKVHDIVLCRFGLLWITPWHPILQDSNWVFPWMVSHETLHYSGDIYSILLEQHPHHNAHAVMIGGYVCVSLGHGIQTGHDIRTHDFFGSYQKVSRSLQLLPRDSNGVFRCSGIRRHPKSGLACGFVACARGRKHCGEGRWIRQLKSKAPSRRPNVLRMV